MKSGMNEFAMFFSKETFLNGKPYRTLAILTLAMGAAFIALIIRQIIMDVLVKPDPNEDPILGIEVYFFPALGAFGSLIAAIRLRHDKIAALCWLVGIAFPFAVGGIFWPIYLFVKHIHLSISDVVLLAICGSFSICYGFAFAMLLYLIRVIRRSHDKNK